MNRLCAFTVLAILGGFGAARAQSYDDLVHRTQSALADYMQGKPAEAVQTVQADPPPEMPALVKPAEQNLALRSPAIDRERQQKINPLLTPWKLEESYRGIRRDLGMMVVSYTFDSAMPQNIQAKSGAADRNFRALTETERKAVAEVLHRQLPSQVALRFEQASHPQDAYLRITAGDLSNIETEEDKRLLGYASYPNPGGGHLVIDRNICAPLKPDCILLKGVVRHEIGHTLGLQHPQEAGTSWNRLPTVMQAANLRYNDYQPQDIATLQQLYGATPGARALARQTPLPGIDSPEASEPPLAMLASLSQLLQRMMP